MQKTSNLYLAREIVGKIITDFLTEDLIYIKTGKKLDGKVEFITTMNLPYDNQITAYYYQDENLLNESTDLSYLDWDAEFYVIGDRK